MEDCRRRQGDRNHKESADMSPCERLVRGVIGGGAASARIGMRLEHTRARHVLAQYSNRREYTRAARDAWSAIEPTLSGALALVPR